MDALNNKNILATGLAAAGFMLFGRYITAALVSKGGGKKLTWPTPDDSCYINCPGGNVLYAEFDGPVNAPRLVFIHGVNANHTQWYYQRQYFRKRFRLVFIDLPLQLENYSYRLSMQALAADINYALKQLDIKNAVIYGHSMGGTVLLEYCLRYLPCDTVRGIVMHGTPYTNPVLVNPYKILLSALERPVMVPVLKLMKRYRKVVNILSRISFLNGTSSFFYRFVHFTGKQTAAQLMYATAMAPTNDSGAFAESILQLMQYDAAGKMDGINIPALIIGSNHDRLNTLACAEYIHRHIRGSQLLVLDEGHQAMIENHQHVNCVLDNFIKGLS